MVPCAGTPLGVAQLHRLHGPLFLCLNRISSWFSARNAPCARLPYSQGPGAGRAERGRRKEGWGGRGAEGRRGGKVEDSVAVGQ